MTSTTARLLPATPIDADPTTPDGRRQRLRAHRADVELLLAFLLFKAADLAAPFDPVDRSTGVDLLDRLRASIATNLSFVRPWQSNRAAAEGFQQSLLAVAAGLPDGASLAPDAATIAALRNARDALVTLAANA